MYATVKNMLGYEVDESILKPDDSILDLLQKERNVRIEG